jgi:hypothetical protein
MGGACGTYGVEEKCVQGFGNMKEENNLQDIGIDGDNNKVTLN